MKNWIKSLFSASNDSSYSRVASAVCVVGSIAWVTHIVFKTHSLPDFSGLSLFNGSIYGMGKINETIQKMTGPGTTPEVHTEIRTETRSETH